MSFETSTRCTGCCFAQAHYACARESTVFELGMLPVEVLATQGVGVMSCSLGVSVYTEIFPCRDVD